jgi:hypothetical protein
MAGRYRNAPKPGHVEVHRLRENKIRITFAFQTLAAVSLSWSLTER